MLGYPLETWPVFCVCAFIVALNKTGIPGIGMLAVTLAASAMDAKESVGFLLIMGDLFAVAWYRQHASWRHLVRLMPAAVVGIAIGYALLGELRSHQLRPIIGAAVLAMLALDWWWQRGGHTVPDRWWFAAAVGVAAGVLTALSNAAGPLIIIYFAAMQFDKEKFMGTGAWYFLVLNCIKVPLFVAQEMITVASFKANLALLPAVLLGAWAGRALLRHIPQRGFVIAVKALAAAAGLQLLLA